jgi:hypothetical protein
MPFQEDAVFILERRSLVMLLLSSDIVSNDGNLRFADREGSIPNAVDFRS